MNGISFKDVGVSGVLIALLFAAAFFAASWGSGRWTSASLAPTASQAEPAKAGASGGW
jgi:hypothetical protein